MSVYKKLQEARILLQNTKLNKSGKNKFAGYEYFELADFLPAIQNICHKLGLCGVVSFDHNMAYLQINDVEDGTSIMFTSPMSSAALKGCHDVQNLGATISYLRRYLWVNCFEICEHDAIEPLTGKDEPVKKTKDTFPDGTPISKPNSPVLIVDKPKPITGQTGEWQIVAPAKPEGDVKEWLDLIKSASHMLLDLTADEEDVMLIFKKNKVLFDTVKATDGVFFKEMMGKFTERKTLFTKE
jgi:hypothetical protein